MLKTVREFTYQKLTPEEQQARGILGRLVGVMADFKHPTRNDRLYTESLWDKTFENPIVKEKLENRCMFGELGHPSDRTEIDMEKIAICLAEEPKKMPDGTVNGVFDILNTPNGRILKTLCDYGCNIGVSSRGTGDVVEDFNGNSTVDDDTYECECWDAVLLPAVKTARPKYVTESLNIKNKTLKSALLEELNTSKEDERKVMEDTLKELNIDYESEKIDDKDVTEDTKDTAVNDGEDLFDELQESLKHNKSLENDILTLQEKLSVCYAKEAKYEEELNKYKRTIINLSESAKGSKELKVKVDSLVEEINSKDKQIEKLKDINHSLRESLNRSSTQQKVLKESVERKTEKLNTLDGQIGSLKESYDAQIVKYKDSIKQLNENLQDVKQNASIKAKEYSTKLSKSNELVEHYKTIAKNAVSKYIATQAKIIGVEPAEIKRHLSENYSFSDIDRVCESLKSYNLNISKLPFNVDTKRPLKMKISESKEVIKTLPGVDDDVDSQLFRLAGLD